MSESAKLGNVTKIKQFEEPSFPGLSKISWVRSVTASHGTGAKPNLKELVLQISPKWRSFPDGSFLSEQIKGYSMNNVQMPQKPALCANSIDQTHILFLLDFHDRPRREALFDLLGTLLTYKAWWGATQGETTGPANELENQKSLWALSFLIFPRPIHFIQGISQQLWQSLNHIIPNQVLVLVAYGTLIPQ